jgi:hypothetical protein
VRRDQGLDFFNQFAIRRAGFLGPPRGGIKR